MKARPRHPAALALAVVFGVNGALYGTLLARYAEHADRLGAAEGAFGLALLGPGVGGLISAALLSARGGRPLRLVAVAGPAMVAAMVAAAVAPTLLLFGLALGGLGLADGVLDPAMNQVAARSERGNRPLMGSLHATWSGATLVATGVGVAAAALDVGLATHATVVGSVLLSLQLWASARLRDVAPTPPEDVPATDAGPAAPPTDGSADLPRAGARRAKTTSGVGWKRAAFVLLCAAAVWIENPSQEWAGLLLGRELAASPGLAATGPFVVVGGLFASRLVVDRLVERFGWRQVGTAGAVVAMVGASVALLGGAVTSRAWPVLLGFAVTGFGAGPAFPLLFARAEDLAAEIGLRADRGAALVAVVTRGAVMAGPVLVGQLAEVVGLFAALALVPLAAGTFAGTARWLLGRGSQS